MASKLEKIDIAMAEVEARRMTPRPGPMVGHSSPAKSPKFDGGSSWNVFWHQWTSNNWFAEEKATYMLNLLLAAVVLHALSSITSYNEIVAALLGHHNEHNLEAIYK